MNDNPFTKSWQRNCLLFIAWCLLSTCLVSVPATAQLLKVPVTVESTENIWQAPDLTALDLDWWVPFADVSAEITSQRVNLFLSALEQRTQGLGGGELIAAQNAISNLKSLFELLALAKQGPLDPQFGPPLAKETYFLDDVLSLRGQWRALELNAAQIDLKIEQTESQVNLLQQRRDKLLRQYEASDPESPSRILIGINRLASKVEYELALEHIESSRQTQKLINVQSLLVSEQQTFAQDHLVNTDVTLAEAEDIIFKAREKVIATAEKVAAVQPQLLDVLSAATVNTSLELLRKQQLTRASADAELAQLEEMLVVSKSSWHHFRAGLLDFGFDIQSESAVSRRLTEEALGQAELWSSISQTTLITPSSDTNLNAVKNLEIAQTVARDTLAIVDQIKSTGDSLLLVQDILTKEMLSAQSGLRNTGARLGLVFDNAWDRLIELVGVRLFNIGETSVT